MLRHTDCRRLVGSEDEAGALSLDTGAIVDDLRLRRVVGGLTFGQLGLDEVVREAQAEVEGLLSDLRLSERRPEDELSRATWKHIGFLLQELVLTCSLLHLQAPAVEIVIHDLLHVVVLLKRDRAVQLRQGKKNGCPRPLVLKRAIAELRQQVQNRADLRLWLVRAVLAQNPGDDLHERIRNVRILLQNFQVDLDRALAELLTLLGALILRDGPDELVCELLSNLITAYLEQLVHVAHVPILIWCKGVA